MRISSLCASLGNELTVSFAADHAAALLDDWRWLVGRNVEVLVISALGDLFLNDAAGRVLWLETGVGRVTQVAASSDEFKQLMQQTEHASRWFEAQLIGDLIEGGMRLEPGQCYGYKLPPMLGGTFEPSNFEPTDLLVHCSLLGQIASQTQGLAEGTRVDGFKMEDDS